MYDTCNHGMKTDIDLLTLDSIIRPYLRLLSGVSYFECNQHCQFSTGCNFIVKKYIKTFNSILQ